MAFKSRSLSAIYSLNNLRTLCLYTRAFTVPSTPYDLTPRPSFSHLVKLSLTVSPGSMNDLDVILRIIKSSEEKLKVLGLEYEEELDMHRWVNQEIEGELLVFYDFKNLELDEFRWDYGQKVPPRLYDLLSQRSNLLPLVTTYSSYADHMMLDPGVKHFEGVKKIQLRIESNTLFRSQLDSIEVAIRNNKLAALSTVNFSPRTMLSPGKAEVLKQAEELETIARSHSLQKFCVERGIKLMISNR